MTTEEKIKVMQGFLAGKEIEVFIDSNWARHLGEPIWNWNKCSYRIKQEPEYQPFDFSDAESLIGKVVKSKKGHGFQMITKVTPSFVNDIHFQYLFDECEFLDGSPCGKLKQ